MINVSKQARQPLPNTGIQRSYAEVVAYLDALPEYEYSAQSVIRTAELDALFDQVSHKIDTILVGGSNGKSLAMNFAVKLFGEEKIKTAVISAHHFTTYNEQISLDEKQINNDDFAAVANEVINMATAHVVPANRAEIMFIASMLYAVRQEASVAMIEVARGGQFDLTAICAPKITVVTRVAEDIWGDAGGNDLDAVAKELTTMSHKDAWFVAAEQSKVRLQKMKNWVIERGGQWAMPIRKLAPLPYVYEQLFGRVASLGERIVQLYVEEVRKHFSPFLRGNLLATQQGQRGRPTLEAKRRAEKNPIKSLKTFWQDNFALPGCRFEILEKDLPTVVLDNASNLDAYMNVFLGVRVLHYKRPFKTVAMIMGVPAGLSADELVKAIRYLLKKVPGEVFFVPLPGGQACHAPNDLLTIAKDLNVKARAFASFGDALSSAKDYVDHHEGLIAVTGAPSVVSAYLKSK